MVNAGRSKSARSTSGSVVAGSVSESRMKVDQVKGGIKVFNGGGENAEVDDKAESRVSEQTNRSSPGPGSAGKRRACKSESNAIQIAGERSPSQLQKKRNRVSISNGNGNCKSPIQLQRKKSVSVGDDQRSPIPISSARSELKLSKNNDSLENSGSDRSVRDADERNSTEEKNSGEGIGGSDQEIEKGGSDHEIEKVPVQPETKETRSVEEKEDDGIGDGSGDIDTNGYASEEDEREEAEERIDQEIEVEKSTSCDEEIAAEKNISHDEEIVVEKNISHDEEIVVEKNISDFDYKEVNVTQVNPSISSSNSNSELNSKRKFSSKPTIAVARSTSSNTQFSPVKKPSPKFSRPTCSSPSEFQSNNVRDSDAKQRVPESHSKLQSLVDLVMWKHVPRSTLVFGVGTFLIISSSYTKDLNISFISVSSYLGLIYLALIFMYKSFKYRHVMEGNDSNYCHGSVLVGEEEAIWLLRLILPFLNEFLLKLKDLFSGDPAVTMKLAAVLFALARCGSSITIWKMVKLGFFAAFILPKFCSTYSTQITGYGKFWILRFQDAWRSCSHKKVLGFAMFTIVWNLSSVVARVWAAFMLFVAVRYYQQSVIKAESWDEVKVETGATSNDNHVLRRQQILRKLREGRRSTRSIPGTPVDVKAAKKVS